MKMRNRHADVETKETRSVLLGLFAPSSGEMSLPKRIVIIYGFLMRRQSDEAGDQSMTIFVHSLSPYFEIFGDVSREPANSVCVFIFFIHGFN